MDSRTSTTAELVATLLGAALSSADVGRRAELVAEIVSGIEPGAVGAVVTRDLRGRTDVVADTGYPGEVIAHLTSPAFLVEDVGYRLLTETPANARCWRDVQAYRRTRSAREVFVPGGFGGGATARLCTADGRCVGDIHLSVESPRHPRASTVRALDLAAPVLARAFDPGASTAHAVEAMVPAGLPCVLVTADGVAAAGDRHPGLPVRDLARLAAAVHRLPTGNGRCTFVWLDGTDGPARLRALPVADGILVHPLTGTLPGGLTRREVEVVSEIARGRSNRVAARNLDIRERTLVHHLERIYDKLGVTTRTEAAVRAVEDGWTVLADR